MYYADMQTKGLLIEILEDGCWDKNPRPVWIDKDDSGVEHQIPAHSLSINHHMIKS